MVKYVCLECKAELANGKSARRHRIQRGHENIQEQEDEEVVVEVEGTETTTPSTTVTRYRCLQCKAVFNYTSKLDAHIAKTGHVSNESFTEAVKEGGALTESDYDGVVTEGSASQVVTVEMERAERRMQRKMIEVKPAELAIRLKCPVCKQVLSRGENVVTHRKEWRCHETPCDICKKKFDSWHEVKVHRLVDHEMRFVENDDTGKNRTYLCPFCNHKARKYESFSEHIKIDHPITHLDGGELEGEVHFTKCVFCDLKFDNRKDDTTEKIRQHEMNNHAVKVFIHKCKMCAYRSQEIQDLSLHLQMKHLDTWARTKWPCHVPSCDELFDSWLSAEAHFCTAHLMVSPARWPCYYCEICLKTFYDYNAARNCFTNHRLSPVVRCLACQERFYGRQLWSEHKNSQSCQWHRAQVQSKLAVLSPGGPLYPYAVRVGFDDPMRPDFVAHPQPKLTIKPSDFLKPRKRPTVFVKDVKLEVKREVKREPTTENPTPAKQQRKDSVSDAGSSVEDADEKPDIKPEIKPKITHLPKRGVAVPIGRVPKTEILELE